MTRNQVLIAAAFGILVALVLLFAASGPVPEKKTPTDALAPAEQGIPQAGSYELAPGTGSAAAPAVESVPEYTVTAEPAQNRPAKKAKPAEVEPADNGYDSVDPGIADRRPEMPPADEIMRMQKRGIVAY